MTRLYEMQCNWHRSEQKRIAWNKIGQLAEDALLLATWGIPETIEAREEAVREACWRLMVASHA